MASCAALVHKQTHPLDDLSVRDEISRESTPFQENAAVSAIDDLETASLEQAIEQSLLYYERTNAAFLYFGNRELSVAELKESLLAFREIVKSLDPVEIKLKKIRNNFEFLPSPGLDNEGTVLFTGYYVPVLEGSPVRTDRFRYPLYRTPDDLVVIKPEKTDGRQKNDTLIGRLEDGVIVPYYSRDDIDRKGLLRNRQLEILWVDDPVALHSLHVQGSGKIRMPDGRTVVVSFAQSNGRTFRPISKFLMEKNGLNGHEIRYPQVKNYLRDHPEELEEILSYNDRYVFFRKVERDPLGALEVPVTADRTIATDPSVFPRGGLGLIKTRKPAFDKAGRITHWTSFSRFVLNQDAGTAIKGPGRVDLFCGEGPAAERAAGSLKEKGQLFILVKKR